MAISLEAEAARLALANLPELAAQESLVPPPLAGVYVPAYHVKALHLDASVVVGMRGAGKSWWTAVLASSEHREFVSEQLPSSSLSKVEARVGFGLDDTEADFPRAETLGLLLKEGIDPVGIWLAVVLRHARRATERDSAAQAEPWREWVSWVVQNRVEANTQLTTCDRELRCRDRVLLVLFDAFDRLATDWETVRRLSSAALQLGLQLRSRRAIRLKFFIRPDLDEDPEIWRFPDSSKLRHAKVVLDWGSTDLFGLVFMHLGNAIDPPGFAVAFRAETSRDLGEEWEQMEGVHLPPHKLTRDAEFQQRVVEGLADRYMGGGPKRGATYTWVPLHLADAAGRISPRSYLLAFKKAAEHSAENRPKHERALHYSSIQQGVVKASEVRVQEIAEDHPWVQPLLEAARGLVVPLSAEELSERWSSEYLREMKQAVGSKLPPRRFTSDASRRDTAGALIDDLVELSVLYRTKDGRINIPDIFRVGFGIRRKGGVKPPR